MKKAKKTKIKTRKSAQRRFKVTARGKVLHLKSFRQHLKSNKPRRASKRQGQVELTGANLRKVKKILHTHG